jgi:hypothetical protein
MLGADTAFLYALRVPAWRLSFGVNELAFNTAIAGGEL